MYNQSFSPKNLYDCTTQSERRNFGLKKEELIKAINGELGQSLIDGSYQFKIKQNGVLYLNGRKKDDLGYLCQDLVLRKLFRNIKHIYSVQQSDRNRIVRQMKILLEENVRMQVVRLDVKHFYESIDRERLLNKLMDDARLNYQSLLLLKTLFNNPVIKAGDGLPRGLGVSAAMAEMYLKYFDLELKRIEGVYFYARFVDDIIVFCSGEKTRAEVWKQAEKGLNELGLDLNREKSYFWDPNQTVQDLTYLGYTFYKRDNRLEVIIAEKKQKVIKTRVTKAFVHYSKYHDDDLLKLRIKYLTGNFTLYESNSLAPIKVGIYFNYKLATDIGALDELDRFYQRLLHCQTGRLGAMLAIPKATMKALEKYSFRFGYEHHVNHHFTIEQMARITDCWR